MIASVLMAIGMVIGVLVEVLLPSGGSATAQGKGGGGGGDGKPENVKEWLRNKLKALASLPGKLGAKTVVGWVSQNLWALAIGIRGLLYT